MVRLMEKHDCLQLQTAEQLAPDLWHAAVAGMFVPVHRNYHNYVISDDNDNGNDSDMGNDNNNTDDDTNNIPRV